jgi:hypothetical protein
MGSNITYESGNKSIFFAIRPRTVRAGLAAHRREETTRRIEEVASNPRAPKPYGIVSKVTAGSETLPDVSVAKTSMTLLPNSP